MPGLLRTPGKSAKRVTLNYGVRYDYEITQQVAPVGLGDPLAELP